MKGVPRFRVSVRQPRKCGQKPDTKNKTGARSGGQAPGAFCALRREGNSDALPAVSSCLSGAVQPPLGSAGIGALITKGRFRFQQTFCRSAQKTYLTN
jgi:hypothetical protein